MSKAAFMAMRVDSLPVAHVPSVKRHCCQCKEEVWVDQNLVDVVDLLAIYCVECVVRREGGGPPAPVMH